MSIYILNLVTELNNQIIDSMSRDISFKIPEKVTKVILKYYQPGSLAYKYFYTHVIKVTELSIKIVQHNPQLDLDMDYIIKGSLLHDIGIIKTDAPEIGCFGDLPYIAHTYLGREILESEGFAEIAPICERHIGTGLSKKDIIKSGFDLPHRDMKPISNEEKLICYADKFYSKSEKHLTVAKSPEKIRKKILKYGEDKLKDFEEFVDLFGIDYIYE